MIKDTWKQLQPGMEVECLLAGQNQLPLPGQEGATITGTCFACTSDFLILQHPPSQPPLPHHPPMFTYRFITAHALTQLRIISSNSGNMLPLVNSRSLNLAKVQARESKALRHWAEEIRRIGVGVTAEAQQIFDALIRTLPCEWDGEVIVVMDGDVRISSPYGPDQCVGTSAVEHVRKVLLNARQRLGL
jgi:hypothetical protein